MQFSDDNCRLHLYCDCTSVLSVKINLYSDINYNIINTEVMVFNVIIDRFAVLWKTAQETLLKENPQLFSQPKRILLFPGLVTMETKFHK